MKVIRPWRAAILAAALLTPITVILDRTMAQSTISEGDLPAFAGATAWLNSPPLTPTGLRGKVVLVDFWTYTCINWRRQFPFVRAWAEKYKEHGLVVIGVHTPEFSFEQDVDNIRLAAKEIKVDYPIAVDNSHQIWDAFDNEAWPALYFVDAAGHIRHRFLGEGDYQQSESLIQQLLVEAGASGVPRDPVSPRATGAEAAADWKDLRSPETYLGRDRTQNFASPGGASSDASQAYTAPDRLRLNQWALAGAWSMQSEAAVASAAHGRIVYRFHARDLHLILAPPARDRPVRFRITIDGAAPGGAHGVDADAEGWGKVGEPRLYQLVRQQGPVLDRTFEIEFFDPGVRAYDFTFG